MDYRALSKAYDASKEEMQLQINSLKDIHADEIRQRDEALQSYREAINELEENYLQAQVDIENERRNRTRDYTRKYSEDKEGLANEIVNSFGFELVE